jgi:hypothetical protein
MIGKSLPMYGPCSAPTASENGRAELVRSDGAVADRGPSSGW